MNIAPTSVTSREYCLPKKLVCRHGCGSHVTSTHRITTLPPGERTEVIQELTAMVLVHKSKNGKVKNSLPLDKIHQQLELDSLVLNMSGASNILLSKVSFDCLVTGKSGKEHREYVSFDLKIPGANTEKEGVFSFDMMAKAYQGQKHLYAVLKYFYTLGRSQVNPAMHTHGHCPDYNPSSSSHDQYIRHTEQLLVAYLALPEAALMLCNYLRAEIRGKFADACSVKVYNMGLHMHSTKTCCAVCENVLLGLMNQRGWVVKNNVFLGFLSNFKKVCSLSNECLTFTFPKRSSFQLVVTVTANQADADHKKQPTYTVKAVDDQDSLPQYLISVKEKTVSQQIFMSVLDSGYDRRKLAPISTLSHLTVVVSGSKATKGTSGTVSKLQTARNKEVDELQKILSLLKV